ncbi:MAG: MOSC domain-containing protein [Actinomycetota bacterium]|nr:MOSC domain-containing protein [Actinomycetota bacterium]
MHVAAVWRYPVKSMQGERVEVASLSPLGVAGDRAYAVRDLLTGKLLSAKREPRLLEARALRAGVELVLRLPNGETVLGAGMGVGPALSAWLGRPVRLDAVSPGQRAAFDADADADAEDGEGGTVELHTPEGSFVDAAPVHLLTTASLAAMAVLHPGEQWDARRFRPNLVVETDEVGFVEDAWLGRVVRAGGAELEVVAPTHRCVMVTRAQPGGLDHQPEVLRALARDRGADLGVYARVRAPGVVRRGDEVTVVA